MALWYWLTGAVIALALPIAIFWFDRFCLWLEDRGWLYYRNKKPTSSAGSVFVAMQQFIEPKVKHVVQVKQDSRSEQNLVAAKERALNSLLDALDASTVNPEVIRFYLSTAQRAGLDWKSLYEEAAQMHRARRKDADAAIPSPDELAPDE
jgi:hypothetical protein